MISIIFAILIIIGIVYGMISGNVEVINNEIFNSSKKALNMILEIMPVLVIWMGLMQIADDSKLLDKIELSRKKKFSRKHRFFRHETKRLARKSITRTKIHKLYSIWWI